MNWAVIVYERGRHTALPNSFCRFGIACVIPMVSEFNAKVKKDVLKPALSTIAFIEADESKVRFAIENIRYVEKVWRQIDGRISDSGELITVPDKHLQYFLDGLEKREKKPARVKRGMNLAEMAEAEWFATYTHLYGLREAVKRFGRDMREAVAA